MTTAVVEAMRGALETLGLAQSRKSLQIAEELYRESAAKRLQERQALAAELALAEAADLADAREAERAVEPLQARVDELRGGLAAAELALAEAVRVRRVAASHASQRRDHLRGALRASAPAALAAFVDEMRELLVATYASRRTVMGRTLENRSALAWDNAASVQARVDAIRAAIAECGELGTLPYAPLDEGALLAALGRLRDALPAVAEPPAAVLRLAG